MPARTPGNELPEHPSEAMHLEHKYEEKHVGVIGNERLTALVSLVLLVLIIVELLTSAFLRIWLPAHTVIGVLLVGPLLVKMGSTGWRFLRYYTRAPAYVRRGPPPLVLRVLGPVLLVTTLVMVGSGMGLVVTGPIQPFLLAHSTPLSKCTHLSCYRNVTLHLSPLRNPRSMRSKATIRV